VNDARSKPPQYGLLYTHHQRRLSGERMRYTGCVEPATLTNEATHKLRYYGIYHQLKCTVLAEFLSTLGGYDWAPARIGRGPGFYSHQNQGGHLRWGPTLVISLCHLVN
jgi:hypothetical protein